MAIYDANGNVVRVDAPVGSDFAIGSDLIRRPISLTQLGTLKYVQSFCVYNGKYYSTSGSKIAEQNDEFAVLRNVSINVGHGNALQLGSNGVAYASGWDDNTVYIVDLATLTVTGTIVLPTTGYTTCIVDDVKKIVYIWQRDTNPLTEEYYNFIVYDYDNEQTLSTSVTSVAFCAMQACDIHMDLMLVLNGGGSSTYPNGFRVYDKTGKIVGEYVIGSMTTKEPEGVFIDRATGEILISFVDGSVYRLTTA